MPKIKNALQKEKKKRRLHLYKDINKIVSQWSNLTEESLTKGEYIGLGDKTEQLKAAIDWQDYIKIINAVTKFPNLPQFVDVFSKFIKSPAFDNLQKYNSYDTDRTYLSNLADYAAWLFICLFKWEEPSKETIQEIDDIKDALEQYYKNRNNPMLKTAFSKAMSIPPDVKLTVALPAMPLRALVKKQIARKPVSFEREGTRGFIYDVRKAKSKEGIGGESIKIQEIINKELKPHIEVIRSPFTELHLVRWYKDHPHEDNQLPLPVEYFIGALYTFVVQIIKPSIIEPSNDIKEKDPNAEIKKLLIEITKEFIVLSKIDVGESILSEFIDDLIKIRGTPVRKLYDHSPFFSTMDWNTIDIYLIPFFYAFMDWKLDILYRQCKLDKSIIEIKYPRVASIKGVPDP